MGAGRLAVAGCDNVTQNSVCSEQFQNQFPTLTQCQPANTLNKIAKLKFHFTKVWEKRTFRKPFLFCKFSRAVGPRAVNTTRFAT